MLRFAFCLTALLLLPLGLAMYWLPQATADILGASPLWLLRGAGGLVTAWALGLMYGALRPDPTGVVSLAAGNLLLAATLGAAAYRLAPFTAPTTWLWGAAAAFLTLGLVAVATGKHAWQPRGQATTPRKPAPHDIPNPPETPERNAP